MHTDISYLNSALSDPDGWELTTSSVVGQMFTYTAIPQIQIETVLVQGGGDDRVHVYGHMEGHSYQLDLHHGGMSLVYAPKRTLICNLGNDDLFVSLKRFRRFLAINFTALRAEQYRQMCSFFQASLLQADPMLTGSFKVLGSRVIVWDASASNAWEPLSDTNFPIGIMCDTLCEWRRDLFVPNEHASTLRPVLDMAVTLPVSAHARAVLLSQPPLPPNLIPYDKN